jgi:teichuronic acid exporter
LTSTRPLAEAVVDDPGMNALDRTLVRGVAWTGGVKWAGQAVAWASTLIVARLLSPADYGLVAMAGIYLSLITLLSEFGIGASVVINRSLNTDQLSQMNTIAALFGLGAFVVSCAAASPLAHWFKSPELAAVVIALSVNFILVGFRTIPQALLERNLRFKRLALFDGIQTLLIAGISVTLAVFGFGYWTLVISNVVSVLLSTALICGSHPHAFARPRLGQLRPALQFSGHLIVQRLAFFTYSNADLLIAGRLLGAGPLGVYSFAWGLASVPVEKVTALISQVTPTIFSSVQSDLAAIRRYVLGLTEALALVTFPSALGLALVADDFVLLVLGEKWIEMVTPLRILAAYAAVRSITSLLTPVLNVTGDARFGARNGMVAAFVLPVAFYIGSAWGTAGLASAWVLAHPTAMIPLFIRVAARLDMGARDYLRALRPALQGSLAMVLVVCAARWALSSETSATVRLISQIGLGAVTYLTVVVVFHHARLHSFVSLLRAARA